MTHAKGQGAEYAFMPNQISKWVGKRSIGFHKPHSEPLSEGNDGHWEKDEQVVRLQ